VVTRASGKRQREEKDDREWWKYTPNNLISCLVCLSLMALIGPVCSSKAFKIASLKRINHATNFNFAHSDGEMEKMVVEKDVRGRKTGTTN
jgi:hypothetical protein